MELPVLARKPWAATVAKAMRATPAVRAAAVVAVRPGDRTVSSRASSPVPWVNGSIGRSITAASGATSQRDATARPMNSAMPTAPSNASRVIAGRPPTVTAGTSAPTPAAPMTAAAAAVPRGDPRWAAGHSRNAAIGAGSGVDLVEPPPLAEDALGVGEADGGELGRPEGSGAGEAEDPTTRKRSSGVRATRPTVLPTLRW
jgi:hypothetical protein